MAKQKVQIRTAEYREDKDLIFWTLLDPETEKEQTYCWPSSDYLSSVAGFSKKSISQVTPKHLHDHCLQMLGKEIHFEVRGNANYKAEIDENAAEAVDKEIQKAKAEAAAHFDTLLKSADVILDKRKPASE